MKEETRYSRSNGTSKRAFIKMKNEFIILENNAWNVRSKNNIV